MRGLTDHDNTEGAVLNFWRLGKETKQGIMAGS